MVHDVTSNGEVNTKQRETDAAQEYLLNLKYRSKMKKVFFVFYVVSCYHIVMLFFYCYLISEPLSSLYLSFSLTPPNKLVYLLT